MIAVKVSIVKFISDHQPGFVECLLTDAWGKQHIVNEKIPIVTEKTLNASSNYPQEGVIACEIIRERKDKDGMSIFTVDTAKPWGVETIEGLNRFDVFAVQLVEY